MSGRVYDPEPLSKILEEVLREIARGLDEQPDQKVDLPLSILEDETRV